MAIKYTVADECKYLEDSEGPDPNGKYPFRMVEFENVDGLEVNTLTERGIADFRPGSYPIAGQQTVETARNKVENGSAHSQADVFAAGFQRVELCDSDFSNLQPGLPFAVKGSPLRLPLIGRKASQGFCSCQCGTRYFHRMAFTSPPILLPNVPGPAVNFRAFFPELFNDITLQDNYDVRESIAISCTKVVQEDTLLFVTHQWSFGSAYISRGVRGNLVPHPKCPSIPMTSIDWATGSVIFGEYTTSSTISPIPTVQWSVAEIFQDIQQGPQIGIFCDDGPRVQMGTVSDITTLDDTIPNLPPQPTISDYPNSEEEPDCPPIFPPWELTFERTKTASGKFQDCDADCRCPEN